MAPYINTDQATLKPRRVSTPSYINLLVKKNVLSEGTYYHLVTERNSPALNLSCLVAKPADITTIDNVIISTSIKFIESFLCFGDDWIFVTQLDAFVRNDPDIDPCALNTPFISYPETPVAKIIQKSFKRTTWNEVVILYGKFEFLVTGGIYGNSKENALNSFLGASMKIKTPANDSNVVAKISIRELSQASDIHKEERLLQNYSRPAAFYKWGIRSSRFLLKGFGTLNLLYTTFNTLESAGSLILRCLAYNNFTRSDQEQLMEHIHATSSKYSLDIQRDDDDISYLLSLQDVCNTKFGVVIRAAATLIKGLKELHKPQTVMEGALATSVFKDVVKYRCDATQNQRVSNETYLL